MGSLWFRRLFGFMKRSTQCSRPRNRAFCQLRVEALEDRALLAVNLISHYAGLNFAQSGGYIPPDTNGAAVTIKFVEPVNQAISVYTPKSTGVTSVTDSFHDDTWGLDTGNQGYTHYALVFTLDMLWRDGTAHRVQINSVSISDLVAEAASPQEFRSDYARISLLPMVTHDSAAGNPQPFNRLFHADALDSTRPIDVADLFTQTEIGFASVPPGTQGDPRDSAAITAVGAAAPEADSVIVQAIPNQSATVYSVQAQTIEITDLGTQIPRVSSAIEANDTLNTAALISAGTDYFEAAAPGQVESRSIAELYGPPANGSGFTVTISMAASCPTCSANVLPNGDSSAGSQKSDPVPAQNGRGMGAEGV
jgi:hypothetical protein